jgi:hypothetical protein
VFVTVRKAGFNASFKSPTDFNTLTAQVNVDMFIRMDTSIFQDPWVSLDQYHSRNSAPTGQDAPQPYRWTNAVYDRRSTSRAKQSVDAAFMPTFLQAMRSGCATCRRCPRSSGTCACRST